MCRMKPAEPNVSSATDEEEKGEEHVCSVASCITAGIYIMAICNETVSADIISLPIYQWDSNVYSLGF